MHEDLTSRVQAVIESVIKKRVSDPRQNLYDAGLVDSLSAVNLLVTLEEQLGISLNVLDFACREDFTVEYIARLVMAVKKDVKDLPKST